MSILGTVIFNTNSLKYVKLKSDASLMFKGKTELFNLNYKIFGHFLIIPITLSIHCKKYLRTVYLENCYGYN